MKRGLLVGVRTEDPSAGTLPFGSFRLERFLRFFRESASGEKRSILTLRPFDHLREPAYGAFGREFRNSRATS